LLFFNFYVSTGKMAKLWQTWSSAVDFGRDNDFYWESTGAFIGPHINWAANEPGGVNGIQGCIILLAEAGIYKWRDAPSKEVRTYICEAKITSL
jgi:hypothetical protein